MFKLLSMRGFAVSVVIASLWVTAGAAVCRASGDEDREVRLQHLEDRMHVFEERHLKIRAPVDAFYSKSTRLGGYFILEGDVKPRNKGASGFSKTLFELIMTAQMADDWRGFGELEFGAEHVLQNPDMAQREYGNLENAAKLEQAWLEYGGISAATVKIGSFFTPFMMNREHALTGIAATETARFNRTGVIVSDVAGVSVSSGVGRNLGYEVYAGTAQLPKMPFTSGAYFFYAPSWEREWLFGVNVQQSTRSGGERFHAFGPNVRMERGRFGFKAEFVQDDRKHRGYYLEPAYTLSEKWKVYYRYDVSDDDTGAVTPDDQVKHMAGLNYLISSRMRVKFEVDQFVYKDKLDAIGGRKDYTRFVGQMAFDF